MTRLPKYTLEYNEREEKWELVEDKTDRSIRSFDTKGDATKGGVLQRTLGPDGGSVKIQLQNRRFQEERTYPRSRDPKRSRG